MKRLSLLIKPASSLCNMRCRYCFYSDVGEHRQTLSYGIMEHRTVTQIINNISKDLDDKDEITIAFQGGEPTLAGLNWFENFVSCFASCVKEEVKVNYALQTNGILIDGAWAEFLRKNNFLVGLSIDGNAKIHNSNRLDSSGRGTFEACMQTKVLLEKSRVEYNVLCVLTNELAAEPDKVWNFILNEKIRYIQFIPCMEGLDEEEGSPFALRPPRFANFYSRLYYWWVKQLEKGNYISVKLFDDTANFFFRGIPSACGINGQCYSQYVVEADGSVYPCDFYVLDDYNTGNLTGQTLRRIFDSPRMQDFLREKRELPRICLSCSYLKMCGGGCKRMRNVVYYGTKGSVCGYKMFLDKCLGPLEYTVKKHFP
ncbi:MAG: SPASM domain-containing protein [Treponema sp.]|nr:SPASM domain-containing protein [Treponema sp.]